MVGACKTSSPSENITIEAKRLSPPALRSIPVAHDVLLGFVPDNGDILFPSWSNEVFHLLHLLWQCQQTRVLPVLSTVLCANVRDITNFFCSALLAPKANVTHNDENFQHMRHSFRTGTTSSSDGDGTARRRDATTNMWPFIVDSAAAFAPAVPHRAQKLACSIVAQHRTNTKWMSNEVKTRERKIILFFFYVFFTYFCWCCCCRKYLKIYSTMGINFSHNTARRKSLHFSIEHNGNDVAEDGAGAAINEPTRDPVIEVFEEERKKMKKKTRRYT